MMTMITIIMGGVTSRSRRIKHSIFCLFFNFFSARYELCRHCRHRFFFRKVEDECSNRTSTRARNSIYFVFSLIDPFCQWYWRAIIFQSNFLVKILSSIASVVTCCSFFLSFTLSSFFFLSFSSLLFCNAAHYHCYSSCFVLIGPLVVRENSILSLYISLPFARSCARLHFYLRCRKGVLFRVQMLLRTQHQVMEEKKKKKRRRTCENKQCMRVQTNKHTKLFFSSIQPSISISLEHV